MSAALGLSRVPTPALEHLLASMTSGRLPCPFTLGDLSAMGFRGPAADVVSSLASLDNAGARAVLQATLAERRHRPPPRLELVWTGPETRASVAHATAAAVERIFREARRSILIGGYTFDSPKIVEPLHTAMVERGVAVTLFLDIPGEAATAAAADDFAAAFIARFLRDVWTFGRPVPDVYYDPRTAAPGPPWVSLHAKCIVADDEATLITSANFTARGQTRNIEAGVLITDRGFAEQLAGHWRQLVAEGFVRRYVG